MTFFFTCVDHYPPPNDIYLMEANFTQLIFLWSSSAPYCTAVDYHINSSNCGHCPNVTNDTTVTCSGFSLDSQVCSLAIRTVVCDNITGNESRSIQITLRGRSHPCHYDQLLWCIIFQKHLTPLILRLSQHIPTTAKLYWDLQQDSMKQ